MSKIMVIGPLELLMDTLAAVEQLGVMQVDGDFKEDMGGNMIIPPRLIDKQSVLEHQLYEKIGRKIDEIMVGLEVFREEKQIDETPIPLNTLLTVTDVHLSEVTKRNEAIVALNNELQDFAAYKVFADALGKIVDGGGSNDVRCLGIQVDKEEELESLQGFLEKSNTGKVALEKVKDSEGNNVIGVVVVETEDAKRVVKELAERRVNIFSAPQEISGLPFSMQGKRIAEVMMQKNAKLHNLESEQKRFAAVWQSAYRRTRDWIDSRLSLIAVTAAVVKSKMCFFIHGWLPTSDLSLLQKEMQQQFQGKVIVEECELAEQDFSRIPTALHNPAYFEPFELFTRLLPMPPYASFDLTPFIGIFFPVFFGMMLGDIGYGLILLGFAYWLMRKFSQNKNVQDGGKILFISSLYTIVFGVLYGELFGTVGHIYLGLQPLIFERHTSIIPMLCFAVAAGVVHVIIGLILGIIVSLRHKMKKEAIFKLMNIMVIVCICVLSVSYFTSSMAQVQKPLFLTIAVVTPLMLLVGGIMAPLELLKNVGNIISYARIMAVGLTSVLLAFVANYMAGRIGSIWAGIVVAVLLHIFNLLLGVFAPTIHSLRLHYVEFLSKFMEPGGKEFKPLGKK